MIRLLPILSAFHPRVVLVFDPFSFCPIPVVRILIPIIFPRIYASSDLPCISRFISSDFLRLLSIFYSQCFDSQLPPNTFLTPSHISLFLSDNAFQLPFYPSPHNFCMVTFSLE